MHVAVRLFARLREIAGTAELRLELPDGALVADAWQALTARHPELAGYTSSISCAINQEYARMDVAVHDGDEIAFLPPVSGG